MFQSLSIALHKMEGPSACIMSLGIIGTQRHTQLHIPEEKLRQLQGMILEWQARKSCTCKELESLLGHLSYAARVTHPKRESVSSEVIHIATRGHPTPSQTAPQLQSSHEPGVVAVLLSKLKWCRFSKFLHPQYMCTQTPQVPSVVEI